MHKRVEHLFLLCLLNADFIKCFVASGGEDDIIYLLRYHIFLTLFTQNA